MNCSTKGALILDHVTVVQFVVSQGGWPDRAKMPPGNRDRKEQISEELLDCACQRVERPTTESRVEQAIEGET